MKKKRPILQDVADRVGVTKMTISRYLRNPGQVSAKLCNKIAIVLDELGYIPNRAPDMLSNATSHAIGVVLPSLINQVFADVLLGIKMVTDKANYQTLVVNVDHNSKKEENQLRLLLSWNIDGVILTTRTHTPGTLRMLEIAGIPVVEIMDSVTPCFDMAVGFDNMEAARNMTNTILKKGYRRTVYLCVGLSERSLQRQIGYEKAMNESNLIPHMVMIEDISSYNAGALLLREVQQYYPKTDSLFCTNDELAVGVLFECQRQGLIVPDQMAIAGFHGYDISQAVTPTLTTVLTPRKRIGLESAGMLLARIGGVHRINNPLDVGFKIIEGGSI